MFTPFEAPVTAMARFQVGGERIVEIMEAMNRPGIAGGLLV
jgi:hypothetical protein